MEKYVSYLDSIEVDTEQHDRTMARLNQKPEPLYKKPLVLRYTGMAACAAVLIFCFFTIPGLLGNSDADTPYNPNNTTIVGLPVDNFSLADLHDPKGDFTSRVSHYKMSDLFSYVLPDFAFVRVIKTEQLANRDILNRDMQTSTVQVLSTIWSNIELPETIPVTQYKTGGCCLGENTNLLREGGVYLLPLSYWAEGDRWYIIGDFDVLFEVDDNGFIWSHSQHEGFNRFDGQDASIVANAVKALMSDENILSAVTLFGRIARDWGVLAEVTVLGDEVDLERWGWEQNILVLRTDRVLSIGASKWYTWKPEKDDEIRAVSFCRLEQGERYLILIDPSENGPYISGEHVVAKINADSTITAISKDNAFTEFNGRTVEFMKEEAERAIAWYKAHME